MKDADPLRHCRAPALMRAGNAVRLLRDGREAYPAMLEAIAGALRTVHLETYILRADRTGRLFAGAIAGAARRGVRARLVYDAVGSLGIDAGFVRAMTDAGVSAHAYRPIRFRSLLPEGNRRNHRKLLVVDGRVAFTGGMNVSDDYAPAEDGGGGWRDNQVRVEGPAAAAMDAEFLRLWRAETGEAVPPAGPAPDPAGPAWIRVLANRNLLFRHRIRASYLRAFSTARHRIEISIAYFIPDGGIRRALRKAVRRGVEVRILVPARSDVPFVSHAGRRLHGGLLRAGVRIFEFTGGILHSKTIVVDRVWSAVGSYNIDHRSLFHNLELNLHVADPGLGASLGNAFEADLARSREVTLAEWLGRPWTWRLRDRLAYALRYWL